MRVFLTLVRRELGGYFVSLTGYLIIAMVALLVGAHLGGVLEAQVSGVGVGASCDRAGADPTGGAAALRGGYSRKDFRTRETGRISLQIATSR